MKKGHYILLPKWIARIDEHHGGPDVTVTLFEYGYKNDLLGPEVANNIQMVIHAKSVPIIVLKA